MAGDPRIVIRHAPLNAETPESALSPEITPPGLHYVRTNFNLPALDARAHRVAVEGTSPVVLSMGDLERLPRRTVAVTLECAGNDRLSLAALPAGELWGGGAVSAAVWGGVSLADVLERAGVPAGTVEVLVEGADAGRAGGRGEAFPFARSLPLDKALHPDTLLALDMNGGPIPAEHGAPVRLVVPGWYGMASVKWVTRIATLAQPFAGYFQGERYVFDFGDGAPAAPVREMGVKALVTSPGSGEVVAAGRVRVQGWAWSGLAPITRVEVAVDGGEVWRDARVDPASRGYLWQRWEYDWDDADPGRHTLRARAQDAIGRIQPDAPLWNRLGYGANGVRTVVVEVR